jgi:hypothetical protein
MMSRAGTGKGLDIKGKSAKKGALSGTSSSPSYLAAAATIFCTLHPPSVNALSPPQLPAFVPFMQIHEENHKSMVCTIPKGFRVRVFYSSASARQTALSKLQLVSSEMVDGHAERQRVINDPSSKGGAMQLALSRFMWELEDPTISCLDEYAPKSFGIDLSMRLFWEACVVRQSIAREEGSKYETGRPSAPAFQDMNICALQKKQPSSQENEQGAKENNKPVAVIWQHADISDDPMSPLTLLMAYEEKGCVLPVVSDFDCFLMGTKRVSYEAPMPNDQLDLIRWCISQVETVLDEQDPPAAAGNTGKQGPLPNWADCWLGILKKAVRRYLPSFASFHHFLHFLHFFSAFLPSFVPSFRPSCVPSFVPSFGPSFISFISFTSSLFTFVSPPPSLTPPFLYPPFFDSLLLSSPPFRPTRAFTTRSRNSDSVTQNHTPSSNKPWEISTKMAACAMGPSASTTTSLRSWTRNFWSFPGRCRETRCGPT